MILAVDIGNTTISLAVMRGQRVVQLYAIESTITATALKTKFRKTLRSVQRKYSAVDRVVLCSVVPNILRVAEKIIIRQMRIAPEVIGRDIKVPMKNNYHHPKQVGQDRLVCAYAVKCLYGQPAVIIDFGTAVTFDVVSHRGHYEGGIIVPGIRLSVESLYKNAALLPKIHSIHKSRSLIGKNTEESILSGVFYGYGAMCCGLIDRIAKQMRRRPRVIVTGGYTHLMKKYIASKISKIDKNLVFKGITLLAEEA